jgi:hypothetical protein
MWDLLRRLFGRSKPKPVPVPPPPVNMLLPRQRGRTVPDTYFGMHYVKVWIAEPPAVPYGFYRLLDATPRWHGLHAGPGLWRDDAHFGTGLSRIDSVLWSHHLKGKEQPVLYTLGGGDETDAHNGIPPWLRNESREVIISYWREHVEMMAQRLHGKVRVWEVWNEPDMFFGDMELLVELARNAYAILKRADPDNVVLTPAFTTLDYMESYLRMGGYQWADALSTHMDGQPKPEGFDLNHIRAVERLREQYMPGKSHWITEGHSRGTGNREHDNAIIFRAYLLYWIAGAENYSWYAWDFGDYPDFPGVDWITLADDNGHARQAAAGYGQAYHWLVGRSIQSATRDTHGNWLVVLNDGRTARWNENSNAMPVLA